MSAARCCSALHQHRAAAPLPSAPHATETRTHLPDACDRLSGRVGSCVARWMHADLLVTHFIECGALLQRVGYPLHQHRAGAPLPSAPYATETRTHLPDACDRLSARVGSCAARWMHADHLRRLVIECAALLQRAAAAHSACTTPERSACNPNAHPLPTCLRSVVRTCGQLRSSLDACRSPKAACY